MPLDQTDLKDRVERPCRLIVDRDDANTGTHVAAVTLENDSGERTRPFMCPSEKSVGEVVDRLRDIYPDIDIVA